MKRVFLLLSLLSTTCLHAQTIKLSFPYFAGKAYTYQIIQGDNKDTILSGALDKGGNTVLVIPKAYANYRGITKFALTEGGGMDIIVNHENFTISCKEAMPDTDHIFYTGSAENNFLTQQYKYQDGILKKAGAMQAALTQYTAKDKIYAAVSEEKQRLSTQFAASQQAIARSPLYAARYCEINNMLTGLSSRLDLPEAEKSAELRAFTRNRLDWDAVYTSGLWSAVIMNWLDFQQHVVKNDSLLLSDAAHILNRVQSDTVYAALAEAWATLFAKYGKDNLVSGLKAIVLTSGRMKLTLNDTHSSDDGHDHSADDGHNHGADDGHGHSAADGHGHLATLMGAPDVNDAAPAVEGLAADSTAQQTLLVFFESGCNNCENELTQLAGNYSILKGKGIRVVSIASDRDKAIYEASYARLPWQDKLCDYKGPQGNNFKQYGVVGTPTMFLINKSGTIVGKYARLVDANLL